MAAAGRSVRISSQLQGESSLSVILGESTHTLQDVDGSKPYRHLVFAKILHLAFFKSRQSGVGFKIVSSFTSSLLDKPDEKEIPAPMLALTATTVGPPRTSQSSYDCITNYAARYMRPSKVSRIPVPIRRNSLGITTSLHTSTTSTSLQASSKRGLSSTTR